MLPSSTVVDLAPACKTLDSEGVLLRMLEENTDSHMGGAKAKTHMELRGSK